MNPKTFKIGKKLNLIRLLMADDGIQIDKLAEVAGYESVKDLKNDLGQLFMLGGYPYTPADLIEVNYDGHSVSLSVPVSVDKSVRLNLQEWLTIGAMLEEDLHDPAFAETSQVIRDILARIHKIIPRSEFKTWARNTELMEKAIQDKKRISFSYTSRKGGDSARKVNPLMIFHDKTDYLIGWCLEANAARMYRIESIHNLKVTAETFKPEHSAAEVIRSFRKLTAESSRKETAELLVTETALFNLSRQMETETLPGKHKIGGEPAVKIRTRIIEEDWFTDTISRFGKSVILLKPEKLKERIIHHLRTVKLPEELAD